MSTAISGVEMLRVCTVLQDCVHQLDILGNIMPDTYKGRPEAEMVVSVDLGEIMKQQRTAEQNLRAAPQSLVNGGRLSKATQDFHTSQKVLSRSMEENPLSPDNLAKVQRDRLFVSEVITDVLNELQETGTLHSLLSAVEEEKKRKANLLDIIIREEECRQKTKALQRQLLETRKEKTLELQKRVEMIAHLKDQLQEMKVKTSLEKRYVKNSADLLVYQGQKFNTNTEKSLEEETRMLQARLAEEQNVHLEMESFLKKHQISLEEKLEFWMERYESNMEDKQQELNSLKNNKANNLALLQELAKKYRESEQVVIEDRLEKEHLRRQLQREQQEWDAATKIQSWWRGTLVRRGLGPYKKGKKPKGKEGKKGKKKK